MLHKTNLLNLINLSILLVYYSFTVNTILSNYRLTQLKRFISYNSQFVQLVIFFSLYPNI